MLFLIRSTKMLLSLKQTGKSYCRHHRHNKKVFHQSGPSRQRILFPFHPKWQKQTYHQILRGNLLSSDHMQRREPRCPFASEIDTPSFLALPVIQCNYRSPHYELRYSGPYSEKVVQPHHSDRVWKAGDDPIEYYWNHLAKNLPHRVPDVTRHRSFFSRALYDKSWN